MENYFHVSLRDRTITESYKSTAPFGSRSLDSLEEAKQFIKDNEDYFKKEINNRFTEYELTPVVIKLLNKNEN